MCRPCTFQQDCFAEAEKCDATCEQCRKDIEWILKEMKRAKSELKHLPSKGNEQKQKEKHVAQLCEDEKYLRDVIRVYKGCKITLLDVAGVNENDIDPRPEEEIVTRAFPFACIIAPWIWLIKRIRKNNNAHTIDPLRQPLIQSVYS